MRLVLASGNRGKLAELRGLIGDLPLSLQSLSDFTAAAAEETAPSFVENAILKARFDVFRINIQRIKCQRNITSASER